MSVSFARRLRCCRVKIEDLQTAEFSYIRRGWCQTWRRDAESSLTLLSGRIFLPYGDSLESLKQTLFFSLVFSFILFALIQRLLLRAIAALSFYLPAVMVPSNVDSSKDRLTCSDSDWRSWAWAFPFPSNFGLLVVGVRERPSPSTAVSADYLPNVVALLLPRMVLVSMPHLLVLIPFGRAGGSYLLPSFVLVPVRVGGLFLALGLLSRPVAAAASVKARSERNICGAVPVPFGSFGQQSYPPLSHVKHGFVYP
ncbi:hypothetical protein ACOSQ2_003128 [Xanthoceras sorbifolium]